VIGRTIRRIVPSWVKSRLLRSPPLWRVQFIAGGCVAVAALARLALTPLLVDRAPFSVFVPAILIASLWAGLEAGLSALVLSTLVVDYLWLPPIHSFELAAPSLLLVVVFWLSSGVLIFIAVLLRALVRVLAESEEQAKILAHEMTHRVRNVLGLVQGISNQTLRASSTLPEYKKMFEARLVALARAQELIADDPKIPTDLGALLDRTLEPFGARRFVMSGNPTGVQRGFATSLALLIHELGTNAVKYGALSTPEGTILISWASERDRARMEWKETNGPPVAAPLRTGFGSRLLKTAFPPDHGSASIVFETDGVQCQILFPATPRQPEYLPSTASIKTSGIWERFRVMRDS
jgi:two-component sensor histidine kinase